MHSSFLGYCFNKPLNYLPKSLKRIFFGIEFNYPLQNLPQDLECLYLSSVFNHPLILPKSITHLKFSASRFTSTLQNVPRILDGIESTWDVVHLLPSSLTHINDFPLQRLIRNGVLKISFPTVES